MHVQHHIGLQCHIEQSMTQGLYGACYRPHGQCLPQGLAHPGTIRRCIQPCRRSGTQVGVKAIEVFRTDTVKTTGMQALQMLGHALRVGHRHHRKPAKDATLALQTRQPAAKAVQ
ncbi:hypothetical protein D3C85_1338490 [compost metagenome]